jgi:hypothetical protein
MTKAELFAFISGCRLGVLGSVSPQGVPQSVMVGIAVTEKLEIVFDTLDTTRKYRNLTENRKASFVVGWEGEKTAQFEGEAFLPKGEELARYKRVYFAAWPDGAARESWPGLLTSSFVHGGSGIATSISGRRELKSCLSSGQHSAFLTRSAGSADKCEGERMRPGGEGFSIDGIGRA